MPWSLLKNRSAEQSNKNTENEDIIEALRKIREDMHRVQQVFDSTTDPDMVEACVYEFKAIQARFACYIKMAKKLGLTDMEMFRPL